MIGLNIYVTEKLKLNKDSGLKYSYAPSNKQELEKILRDLFDERGCDADLNDVDVSNIEDMSDLFKTIDRWYGKNYIRNIDISEWDVSNVKTFDNTFTGCGRFNCDLSGWDVSSCTNFESMFESCQLFNSDLSGWDMTAAEKIKFMFLGCRKLDFDVSKWTFSEKCNDFVRVFEGCVKFKGKGINNWDMKDAKNIFRMFQDCRSMKESPKKWDIKYGAIDMQDAFTGCDAIRNDLPWWYDQQYKP